MLFKLVYHLTTFV